MIKEKSVCNMLHSNIKINSRFIHYICFMNKIYSYTIVVINIMLFLIISFFVKINFLSIKYVIWIKNSAKINHIGWLIPSWKQYWNGRIKRVVKLISFLYCKWAYFFKKINKIPYIALIIRPGIKNLLIFFIKVINSLFSCSSL